MANDLTIVIKAVDKASNELKKVKSSTAGLKDMAAGLGVALGAAAVAAGVLKTAYDKLIVPAMQYGLQVKDLSVRLGVTSQEASKMIQVFDDLRIDMGSAQTAFRFLVAQGIQPTIANLADLADQYGNIQDPVEKAQFAMKNFGARGGLEMTKMLVAGGDAIRDMAAEAERLGLVLGENAVQAAQDFYDSTDKMGDSLKGLQIAMGLAFLPTLSDFVDWLTRMMTGLVNATREADTFFGIMMKLGVFMRDSAAARDADTESWTMQGDVLRDLKPVFEGTAESIRELSNAELLMQAAQATLAGNTALADSLMEQYNAAEALDAMLKSISDQLAAGVSADTLGMRGMTSGLQPSTPVPLPPPDTSGWQGALVQIDYTKFPNLQKALADSVQRPVETSLRLLNGMDGRVITTKQNIFQTTYKRTVRLGEGGFGLQHGGDFVVPPGYPNDTYPMNVTSGEHVVVTPVTNNANRSINISTLNVGSEGDRVKFDRQMRQWLGA